jgi:hypothetical protein
MSSARSGSDDRTSDQENIESLTECLTLGTRCLDSKQVTEGLVLDIGIYFAHSDFAIQRGRKSNSIPWHNIKSCILDMRTGRIVVLRIIP